MGQIDVKQLLVDAGMRVLLERGYTGTAVQDIVDRAGVCNDDFYAHFRSKEELGAHVVEVYGRGGARRAALLDERVPAVERLRAYFEAVNNDLAAGHFARGCLIGNFSAEMPDISAAVRKSLGDVLAHWSRQIASVIEQGQRAGTISCHFSASMLASFLLNAWEGAVLRAKVDRIRTPLDEFVEIAFDGVLLR